MNGLTKLVVFRLGEQRFALPLAVVERVVRAAEATPLAKAPPIVIGAIDVEGSVLPVLNVRRRFQLYEREITPDDQFVIAQAAGRPVVLVVDEAEGVIECPAAEIVGPAEIAPGLDEIQGVVRLSNGLAVIHDLAKFLSLDEGRALDEAMSRGEPHGA